MNEIQRVYVKAWRDPETGIVLDEINKDGEMVPTLVFPRPEDIVDDLAAAYPLIAAAERAKALRDVAEEIQDREYISGSWKYALYEAGRLDAARIALNYADEQARPGSSGADDG